MGLTTERKVFLGLAVVAGLALIIDQGILGPNEAAADMVAITADTLAESVVIGSPSKPLKPAAAILMDRLNQCDSTKMAGSLGSSFSLTTMIEPVEPASDNESSLDEGSSSAESFPIIAPPTIELPVLSAAMPSSHGGGAVLGGELMRIGQTDSNGYRLVLVHARSVIVERDGVEYSIEIPRISGHD